MSPISITTQSQVRAVAGSVGMVKAVRDAGMMLTVALDTVAFS